MIKEEDRLFATPAELGGSRQGSQRMTNEIGATSNSQSGKKRPTGAGPSQIGGPGGRNCSIFADKSGEDQRPFKEEGPTGERSYSRKKISAEVTAKEWQARIF